MTGRTNEAEGIRPHGCPASDDHDRTFSDADLLAPLDLRGMTVANRVAMSPMCQYVAENGVANDWHLVHVGSRACGGVGLIVVEATAVTPEGRITPGCLGLWNELHVAPLARIVRFAHGQGVKIAIQLAHAGRKASCDVPWRGGGKLAEEEGGWPVVGPSPVPFRDGDHDPHPLSRDEMQGIIRAFGDAARRAIRAGFDAIELHSAHGYLLHSFLSPLSNRRTDDYGGSLTNRMRLLTEVAEHVRGVMPGDMPLLVRISATDWVDGGWGLEESVTLAKQLARAGVDLIDVSSGGAVPFATVPVGKGYQVPLAGTIRREAGVMTGAVGLISEPGEANDIICRGDADMVFIGRQLLREPYWTLRAMAEMDAEPTWPLSYGYAVRRRVRT